MMKQLAFSNAGDWASLVLRLTLSLIMIPHGAQKLFGWFGGYGYKATMDFFINSIKLPWPIALMIILIEFLGPIGLFLGLGSKIWALTFIVIMIGAIYTTSFQNGFFMNWFGNQTGEGYEYHLLIIGIGIAILLTGSGKFSVDSLLLK